MPTYLAEGSKWSATALLAAFRLALSKSDIFMGEGDEEEVVEELEDEEIAKAESTRV